MGKIYEIRFESFQRRFWLVALKLSCLMCILGQYATAVVEVAKKHGIHAINLWEEMQKDENWRRFLSDGLHLSDDGNKFLFEKVKAVIESDPELKPSNIPMIFPDWKVVDVDNLNITKKFV